MSMITPLKSAARWVALAAILLFSTALGRCCTLAVTEDTSSHVDVTCNGGNDGQIVLNTATGGSGSGYQYSSDGGLTWQSDTTFSGLSAGTYQMVAEDDASCTTTDLPVTITEPAAVTVTENTGSHTDVTCNGGSDGQIVLNTATGGSGTGYEYSSDGGSTWQSSPTFSGLTAGTYSMAAQDDNNCVSATVNVTITEPAVVSVTEDSGSRGNITCNGGSDGQIVLNPATGGSGSGYQYSLDGGSTWQSSPTFSGLTAGIYAMVAEDGNGCESANVNVTLTEPGAVAVTEHTASRLNVTCNGGSDGQIVLNPATGGSGSGYQYSSDGGSTWQSSTTFSGLAAGTYSMAAEDGNGCASANINVTLTGPAVVTFTENTGSHLNVSCNGGANGRIVLNPATGGSGSGYQYSADGGSTWQSSATFNGLTAGIYAMAAEDGNGCVSATANVTITEPTAVSVTLTPAAASKSAGQSASVTAAATGGSGSGYSYAWTGPNGYTASTATIILSSLTRSMEGSYVCTATDGNGCAGSSTYVLTYVNTAPVANPVGVHHVSGLSDRIPFGVLLANDTDVDGDTLSITAIDSATADGASLALDGASVATSTMVVIPADAVEGDTFGCTISDGYGGSTTGTVTIHVTSVNVASSPLYILTTNYPAGTAPVALCLADLRANGLSRDLVVANSGDNTVSVRLCLDNGYFGRADSYPVGANPQAVCYADFNKDGMDDIATANFGDGTVSVLTNMGVGANFSAAQNYAVGTNSGSGPKSILALDLNRDGKTDLVVADQNENSISVLTNTGGGGFGGLVNYPVGLGPVSVAAGYLGTNGCPDIVTANQTAGTLTILYGQTNGTLTGSQTVTYAGGNPGPVNVQVVDFNRDGIPDLIVANYNSNTVSLLAGYITNGTWQIKSNVTLNVGNQPVSLLYRSGGEDFNHDGYGDLAVLNAGDKNVQVFFGDATGNFTDQGTFPVGNGPRAIAGSNFNNDNTTDFAVANTADNTVSILLYSGPMPNSLTFTVDELTTSIPLSGQDLAGDSLTYYLETIPTNGILALATSPTSSIPITDPIVLNGPVTNLVFTPFTNVAGPDAITFQIISGIPSLMPLYSFTNGVDGAGPKAGLISAGAGILYGTAAAGGSSNDGAIFSVTTNGTCSPLYSFTNGVDGASPYSALVLGADGNLYGTASAGGSNHLGTIFRITTTGAFTPLYSFASGTGGATPLAGLVLAGDGSLYGTTSAGGSNNLGTVFHVTTNGTFTPLYSFTGGADGATPMAGLVLANDGYLYGTTSLGGGDYDGGTVFRIATNGAFAPLYSFTGGSDGSNPQAGLIQGADGSLYGTASAGGDNSYGTVFQVTTNGILTPLYSFLNDVDGATPLASLIQGGDGSLYGTASSGGTNGLGSIYKINPEGVLTPVYSFTGTNDGSTPLAGLVQAGDKYLYGSASVGGRSGLNHGTLFKLLPGSGTLTSSTGLVALRLTTAIPRVAITAPTNNAEFPSNNITLAGTASDDARISQVFVSLNGGTFTPANVTNSTLKAATWGLPLTLVAGTNLIQVQSMDYVSNLSAVVTGKVFYRNPSVLTLITNGGGSIASTVSASGTPTNGATLYLGRSYTVTATARANYTFDHWSLVSSVATNTASTARLVFVMQPGLVVTANFYTNAPVITVQPRNATVFQGVPAVFAVTAIGDGLKYQWQSNGVPLSGALYSSYTNTVPNTNGVDDPTLVNYSVVVTNGGGSVASSAAVLTVKAATNRPSIAFSSPAINAQLASSSVTVAGTAVDYNTSVKQVWVSLNGGAYQAASLTNNPSVSNVKWGLAVSPAAGTNHVNAYCADFAGNLSATNSRSFFLAVPTTVTVNITGSGVVTLTNLFDSVTPASLVSTTRLFVGRAYTLTATAAPNNLFSNWVNNTASTFYGSNVYTFTVVTNLTLTANFIPNRFLAAGGTYYGLFTDTNNGVGEASAGWFTATVTPSASKQTFSASLFVDGDSLSGVSGTFNLAGATPVVTVPRKGKASLALSLQLGFDSTIGGSVSNPVAGWNSILSGDRAANGPTNPSPYLGTYNLLIPGFTSPADGPVGYGYATVKVATNGTVSLASGTLADGQPFVPQTAAVSQTGDWPVYAKAYVYGFDTGSNIIASYAGAVVGWVNFTNGTPAGDLFWIKPGWTNGYYDDGFTNESAIISASFTNTPAGLLVTNGLVTLTGGNLAGDITNHVSISNAVVKIIGPTNAVLKLTFTPATCLVGGTFTNVTTHKLETLKGLYLPGTNIVGGFFMGTNQDGGLLIQ